jgi:hypothetical protein
MRLRPNADEPILSAAGQGEPGLPAACFAPAAWVYSRLDLGAVQRAAELTVVLFVVFVGREPGFGVGEPLMSGLPCREGMGNLTQVLHVVSPVLSKPSCS